MEMVAIVAINKIARRGRLVRTREFILLDQQRDVVVVF
jgi:hypothetical protein